MTLHTQTRLASCMVSFSLASLRTKDRKTPSTCLVLNRGSSSHDVIGCMMGSVVTSVSWHPEVRTQEEESLHGVGVVRGAWWEAELLAANRRRASDGR